MLIERSVSSLNVLRVNLARERRVALHSWSVVKLQVLKKLTIQQLSKSEKKHSVAKEYRLPCRRRSLDGPLGRRLRAARPLRIASCLATICNIGKDALIETSDACAESTTALPPNVTAALVHNYTTGTHAEISNLPVPQMPMLHRLPLHCSRLPAQNVSKRQLRHIAS